MSKYRGDESGRTPKKRLFAFHLALDAAEGGAVTEEWLIGRVCEEFHCRPSEALNEDFATVMQIMTRRAYRDAKAVLDNTDNEKDLPNSPVLDEVVANRDNTRREKLSRGMIIDERE